MHKIFLLYNVEIVKWAKVAVCNIAQVLMLLIVSEFWFNGDMTACQNNRQINTII